MEREPRPLLLSAAKISKTFGPVRVLDEVSFELRAGETHVLAGENGAGKSTLIKILAGILEADSGTLERRAPVAVVHQELSLVDSMSAEDNLFLGNERSRGAGLLLDRPAQRARAQEVCRLLDLDIDLSAPVETHPMSVKNRIEIAKALLLDAKVLILDEPTSALTKPECERFFEIIERLKTTGCAIVYISHKMEEIYRLADRITVLRDGRYVGTAEATALPERELIRWMVGRELAEQFPRHDAVESGVGRLRVNGLTVGPLEDISFTARAGEIVGFAGLQGSGNSELFSALFGVYGAPTSGEVTLDGRALSLSSPKDAWSQSLAYVTNDRKDSGLVLGLSIAENIALPSLQCFTSLGWLRTRAIDESAAKNVRALSIRSHSVHQAVETLSGGNQQKVVLAKCLETKPTVLLLDEPTRGVDIGAKHEIYELINRLAAEGVTILLISTEMPELLALSDRVLVMHRGHISAELPRKEATQELILRAAMTERVA